MRSNPGRLQYGLTVLGGGGRIMGWWRMAMVGVKGNAPAVILDYSGVKAVYSTISL